MAMSGENLESGCFTTSDLDENECLVCKFSYYMDKDFKCIAHD